MLKKWTTVFALVLFIGALAGCGGQKGDPQAAKSVGDWPTKSIEMVVPFKAGGDTDFNARTYAKYLEKELGQSIVVVNTEGAGGSLAAEKVKNAKADGYKIFFANTGFLLNKVTGISDYRFNEAFDTVGIVANSAGECIAVNVKKLAVEYYKRT